MDTQLKYIKVVLLVGLLLLVLIICVVARKLSTMECAEISPMQMNSVSQEQNTPSQNQGSLPADGTTPVAIEIVNTPPPAPTVDEIKADQTVREAELRNAEQGGLYPDIKRMVTPEERIQDSIPQ